MSGLGLCCGELGMGDEDEVDEDDSDADEDDSDVDEDDGDIDGGGNGGEDKRSGLTPMMSI